MVGPSKAGSYIIVLVIITTNLHQDQDQDQDQDLPLMFGNDVAGVINAGTAG